MLALLGGEKLAVDVTGAWPAVVLVSCSSVPCTQISRGGDLISGQET